MEQKPRSHSVQEVDGLRLFALGRIPRCTDCPRYHALVRIHASGPVRMPALPEVPVACAHQVCAPLADRYLAPPAVVPGLRIVAFGS